MKKILTLCTALVVLLTSLLLSACASSGLSEDEIRATCRDLVEKSYALNEVYFGEGLPYTTDSETMKALLGFSPDNGSYVLDYYPVATDAAFQSEEEIRAATAAVFTDGMCASLFEIAFSGVSTEDESRVAFARFLQQGDFLTVRVGLKDSALPIGRTYRFEEMRILVNEENRIRVEIPSEMDGKASVNVKITMIKTADGWRLDSPTY